MKNNIIFIFEGFKPNLSAVGRCVFNISKEFSKSNVIYLTNNYYAFEKDKNYNNLTIKFYETISLKSYNFYLNNKLNNRNLISLFFLIISKIFTFYYVYFGLTTIDKFKVKSIEKELATIASDGDIIFPVCSPIESILASIKVSKYKNLRIFPLLFDTFSINNTLNHTYLNKIIKFRHNINLEKFIFKNATSLFYVNEWHSHITKHHANSLINSTKIEHPLLNKNLYYPKFVTDKSTIDIYFFGTLYIHNRSPKYFIKLFSKLLNSSSQNKKNFSLKIYASGSGAKYVEKIKKKHKQIEVNGYLNDSRLYKAYKNSDILLSIGNKDISQFPSKIIEYVSTGKPIIHTYKNLNDPVLSFLKNYNNCITVFESKKDFEYNLHLLQNFVKNLKLLPLDDICTKYNEFKPSYIKKILENRILEK